MTDPAAPNTSSWRPLLTGEAAAQALEVVREIAQELRRRAASDEASAPLAMGRPLFSLVGGWAGQSLFFAYLDRALPGEGYDETASDFLDRALDELGSTNAHPGLYSGLAGVGWTVEHLRGMVVDEEDDPAEEIAELIARLLSASPWPLDYDLISGLVSFGIYGVERREWPWAGECRDRAVARLSELAERGPDGIAWRMPAGQGPYNLGVAHGIPGVVGWLGQVCASGMDTAGEARALLDGAVPWLLARQNPPDAVSRFPTGIGTGPGGETSRLAWCYGDLGIATALWTAAQGTGEAEWAQAAAEVARAAAARPLATTEVDEPGICHGATGNAHLFNRLWQGTGDPALAEAARFWIDQALAMRRPGEELGGFCAYLLGKDGSPEWLPDPGFLTGSAGIGLVLLAAATAIEPAWDRLLLASAPHSS